MRISDWSLSFDHASRAFRAVVNRAITSGIAEGGSIAECASTKSRQFRPSFIISCAEGTSDFCPARVSISNIRASSIGMGFGNLDVDKAYSFADTVIAR